MIGNKYLVAAVAALFVGEWGIGPPAATSATAGASGWNEPFDVGQQFPRAPGDLAALDVGFPPRDEAAAFRRQLEVTYRDVLKATPITTFVDSEGTIVWTQEYLRYRVNGCGHADAVARVVAQILGGPVQPVCSQFTGTAVAFPPRNEPLAFRQTLEAVYRDTLRRSVVQSFVDAEGDIVWTQEYYRYRVNGCNNLDATDRVVAQVLGGPVAPVCLTPTVPTAVLTVAEFVSSVTAGTTRGDLVFAGRPTTGTGPVLSILGERNTMLGGATQLTVTASQFVDRMAIAVSYPAPNSSAVFPATGYFLVRLPFPQTTIPLTIRVPVDPPYRGFLVEVTAAVGAGPFGSVARQSLLALPFVSDSARVEINLVWDSRADVDLHVVDPAGEELYHGNRRSATGGELDDDANARCLGADVRSETVRWPIGFAPPGRYVVRVNYWSSCGVVSTNYIVRVVTNSSSQAFNGTFAGPGGGGGPGSGMIVTTLSR